MMLYWIVPVDFIFTVRRSDESIVEAYTLQSSQWYAFAETPKNTTFSTQNERNGHLTEPEWFFPVLIL